MSEGAPEQLASPLATASSAFNINVQRRDRRLGRGRSLRSPQSPATYFEKGSDFPVGKPLPCVLVSTFPQCTATWLSLCSTVLQYSCCEGMEGGREGGRNGGMEGGGGGRRRKK